MHCVTERRQRKADRSAKMKNGVTSGDTFAKQGLMNCRPSSDGENTCITTHGDTFQSNNVSQYDDKKPALKFALNSFLCI